MINCYYCYHFSFFRDDEFPATLFTSKRLVTIREDSILHADRHYSVNEDSDFRESIEMSDEQTSLVRSGVLSNSYTEESCSKFNDTAQHTYGPSETVPEVGHVPLHSSVMTEMQASLFLPSLLLSGYSSVRHNYDQIVQESIVKSIYRRSMIGSQSVMMSLIEKISDDRGASFSLTIANILPCLLGSSLFTMPYVIRNSGYITMVILILLAILSNYTAVLLLDSMYEISPRSKKRKRVCGDYAEIAKVAFGDRMAKFVNCVLIFYLSATNVVVLILIGNTFYALLSMYVPLSKLAMTAIFSILVIPALFVRKLSHLAYLSLLSMFCVIVGGASSLILFILKHKSWKDNVKAIPIFDWEYFALALSVWLYTLIVQSIAPQVEGCMREPSRVTSALIISFASSTVIKIFYGMFGAMAFGMSTLFLVTNNVISMSHPVGSLVNAAVGIYAIACFPLTFFVVGDAIDVIALGKDPKKHKSLKKGGKYHFLWIAGSRVVAVGVGIAIAVSIPYFGPVVGILGAVLGSMLVYLLPCLFHLKIKWKKLNIYNKVFEIAVLVIGVTAGIIGLYAAVKSLYMAITG